MGLLDEQSTLEANTAAAAVLHKPIYLSKIFHDSEPSDKSDDRHITIGDMLEIKGAFSGHRIISKLIMVKDVKQKLDVGLKEAMYIVEFFMEEFCTKFDIVIDPSNPNSSRHVTYLKEELWGTKIYDLQSEVRAYKLQCSHEYFAKMCKRLNSHYLIITRTI